MVTCPPPENIDRGYKSNNEQRPFDYTETVKYGCLGEFVLEGSFQIVCQKNGNWSEKPSCKGEPTREVSGRVALQTVVQTFLRVYLDRYQFGFICLCSH